MVDFCVLVKATVVVVVFALLMILLWITIVTIPLEGIDDTMVVNDNASLKVTY